MKTRTNNTMTPSQTTAEQKQTHDDIDREEGEPFGPDEYETDREEGEPFDLEEDDDA